MIWCSRDGGRRCRFAQASSASASAGASASAAASASASASDSVSVSACVSACAGELWLLPSLESLTGDCLVLKRKVEVESADDARPRFFVVITTLSVTRTPLSHAAPGKPADCHSLLETRKYMSGTDCVARTRRVYTRQTFFGKDDPERIGGVKDVEPAEAVRLLHT